MCVCSYEPLATSATSRIGLLTHTHTVYVPGSGGGHNIINIKKKSFSGEVKDSVIFPFFFLLHKRAKHIHPPYIHPSAYLSTHTSHAIHPYLTHRPPIRPSLGNVAKLIRRRRISLKRDNHPQNHGCTLKRASASFQKHGSACTTRMQPARAQRIASHPVQRSAPTHASHPVQRSAPRECNQPARSALHRKQSAHRAAQRTDPHIASRMK
jgi:hypothetical protein